MLKKKLKEIQKASFSTREQNEQTKNGNQILGMKRPSYKETLKNNEKFSKRNLPELKLAKNKKIELEDGNEIKKQKHNQSLNNLEINSKLTRDLRQPKSHSQVKKTDVMLPKIKYANAFPHISNQILEPENQGNKVNHNLNIGNFVNLNGKNQRTSKEQNKAEKEKILKEINEIKENTANSIKEIKKYGINNNNLYSQGNFVNPNSNLCPIKNRNPKKNTEINHNISYREKEKKSNFKNANNNYNYAINGQKLHQRKQKSPQNNKHNIPFAQGMNNKFKSIKKENSEGSFRRPLLNHTNIKLTTIPGGQNPMGSHNLESPNLVQIEKTSQENSNNLIIPNYNSNNEKIDRGVGIGGESSTLSSISSSSSSPSELDLISQRFNVLQSLLSSLSSLSSFPGLPETHPVEVSPEILSKECKNFVPPEASKPGQLDGSFAKAFAFASSIGNVRDHNEDTISVEELKIGGEKARLFAVYDGHGGSGCSEFLKENLYKYIEEFSEAGVKSAISKAESEFSRLRGLDEAGNLLDSSGSCGILALLHGRRLIIANVGDSRLVLFKNMKPFFETEDHKPGTAKEKERIEKAGGKVYQTPSIFPLFQNGVKIDVPWRVFPGRLSVSRTFGDVEAKEEKLGGVKGVVVAEPDVSEFLLDESFNFLVIGCDGIFDVLSNNDLLKCLDIARNYKKIKKETEKGEKGGKTGEDEKVDKDEDRGKMDDNQLCYYLAETIIRAAQAKDSFDNVSVVVVSFNLDTNGDNEESKESDEKMGIEVKKEII